MDRIISDEERIRRAEDVLERRKNTDLRISSESFVKERSNTKIRNMLIQIVICLLIYCGIYYVRNSNNESLKKIVENINSVLEHDIDFKILYEDLCKKYESFNFNNKIKEQNNENEAEANGNSEETTNINNEQEEDNNSEDIKTEDTTNQQSQENVNMGIGGSTEELVEQTSNVLTEEEQMMADSEYIKGNFNIINPLSNGIVTSRFGSRASSEIVSANHKGIDLGATTGTIIISAMEGTVIEASSKGDFGLHLKIANGDVTVIYAHCSELLVKEGDQISQGKEIAKVGSTGKATGPHLHFEVRRENRAVNPEYLLQF